MPTVSLYRDDLFEALGKQMSEEEFNKKCFQFGLELDEVTSEKEMMTKEKGAEAAKNCDERVIWKVDIPANRHDLLCMEGLIKALQIFEGKIADVCYRMAPSRNALIDGVAIPGKSANVQLFVKKAVAGVRPFMVSAILRNIKFTPGSLQSFIDYQDKLHQNICRRRTLASIGELKMLIEFGSTKHSSPFAGGEIERTSCCFPFLEIVPASLRLLRECEADTSSLRKEAVFVSTSFSVIEDSHGILCHSISQVPTTWTRFKGRSIMTPSTLQRSILFL